MTALPARWQAIGIFGGTFDPIHYGHLRTAFECRMRLGLEEIRFVPCADPPHRAVPLAPARVRMRMVAAAVAEVDGFVADSRELDRAGPSYTIDTLDSMRRDFPDRVLCLILGLDAFAGFAAWHRWSSILDVAHIVVARRPGSTMPAGAPFDDLLAEARAGSLADLKAAPHGRILEIDVTQLDISSTDLRASIAAGIRPVYLLPDSVWQVITEARCYGA